MEAKDTMKVVDTLSTIDNNAATSFMELAEGMKRSSSSAQMAGVTMQQLSSYVGVVSSTTRKSAESIGESFKTIFARYQDIKQGKNFDAENESLSNVETSLNRVSIALRKDKTHFKDFSVVIDELGKKWNTFNDLQKSDIAKSLAGTRQRENFLVLMQNLDKVADLQEKVGEAGGSAKSKFDEYFSKSTEAKINDLKRSLESLWKTLIQSDVINKAIDGTTNFVKTLELLGSTAKGSSVAIFGLGLAWITLFKNTKLIIGAMERLDIVFSSFSIVAKKAGVITALSEAFTMLGTSISGVTIALLKNPLTWFIVVLGGATYALIKHINHQKELKESADNSKASYDKLNQALKDNSEIDIKTNSDDLKKTQDDYKKLLEQRKKLEGKVSSAKNTWEADSDNTAKFMLYKQAERELSKLNNKISEQKDILKKAEIGFNEYTGEIYKVTEAQNKLSQIKIADEINNSSQSELENKKIITELGEEYLKLNETENKSLEQKERITEVSKQLQGLVSGLTTEEDKNGNIKVKNVDLIKKEVEMLSLENVSVKDLVKAKLQASKQDSEIQIGMTNITYREINRRIKLYEKELEAINSWKSQSGKTMSQLEDEWKKGTISKEDNEEYNRMQRGGMYTGSRDSASLEELKKAKNEIDDIFNSTGNLTNEVKDGYIPAEDGATKSTKENTEAVKAAKLAMKEYENAIKDLDNTIKQIDYDLGNLDDTSNEYIKKLDEKGKLLQQELELTNKAISSNNANADSLKNLAGAYDSVNKSSSKSYSGKYSDVIGQASAKYGVDKNLIAAIIQQESDWNPNDTSSAGAMGLMQLMPDTARELGVKNAYDPSQNIMGGTKLISNLLLKYKGNVELALAAYNAGEGNVQKYGGVPPFAQTQDYIPKVLGYYKQFSGGKAIPNNGKSLTLDSGAEDIVSKVESLKGKLIDLQSALDKVNVEKVNTKLRKYDSAIEETSKKINIVKNNSELWNENNVNKVNYLFDNSKLTQEKYTSLINKEKVITDAIKSNSYSDKVLSDYKKKLLEIKEQQTATIKELHDSFANMFETSFNFNVKDNLDLIEKYQDELEIIDLKDNKNYEDKIFLNEKMLDQKEKIKQKEIDDLKILQAMLSKEKYESTKQVWLKLIEENNKNLKETEKTILQIKNTIEQLNLENKLKTYNNELDKISHKLELIEKIDKKNYSGKVDLINKEIDLTSKKYKTQQEEIDKLQSQANKLPESSKVKLELEDKIVEKIKKQAETENQIVDLIQRRKNLTLDETLETVEKQIYNGKTKEEFEENIRKKINALKDQLEVLNKQNESLAEQEERQKKLLELEELKMKLNQAQNNLNVKQFVKDKDGNWQYKYVADQKAIDDLEKQIRDKNKDKNKWEVDLEKKHEKDKINEQIKGLEDEVNIRKEAMDRIKNDLVKALDDEKKLFKNNTIDVNRIISNSLDDLNEIYNNKHSKILNSLRNFSKESNNILKESNNNFVNSQTLEDKIINNEIHGKDKNYIYGSGSDLINAKRILGDGYEYVDTSNLNDEEIEKLRLGKGDIALGGQLARKGISDGNLGNGTRLGGKNREETAERIRDYALDNGIDAIRTVYASGKDLENAISILGTEFYRFVDINKATTEQLKQISGGDLVIGGNKVTKDLNDADIRTVGAERLWGQNSDETAKEIKKWQDNHIYQERDYQQKISSIKRASGQINLKNLNTNLNKEETSVKYSVNRNTQVVGAGLDNLNVVTYDKMGNLVVTIQGKVEEASSSLIKLIQLQQMAGMPIGTPTDITTPTQRKTVFASGKDLQNAKEIFGNNVDYVDISKGASPSQLKAGDIVAGGELVTGNFTSSAISNANAVRIYGQNSDLTKRALENFRKAMLGFDTGGYTGDWGNSNGKMALLHEKEIVLNKYDTPNLLKAVDVTRTMSNFLGNFNLPSLEKLFNKMSTINKVENNIQKEQPIIIEKIELPSVKDGQGFIEELKNLTQYAVQFSQKTI